MAKTIKKATEQPSEENTKDDILESDIEIDDLPEEMPKGKSLKDTMKIINKKFGDKTMITLKEIPDFPRLPSGVHAVDYTIGGGFPITHSSCLYGGFSGGKTTLALNTVAVSQVLCMRCYRPEKYCVCSTSPFLVDSAIANVESTLDNKWAKTIGVDTSRVYPIQADSTEMYMDILDQVLQSDECGLVVFDSIGALVAMAEMDKAAEASNMGVAAKTVTKLVKRLKQRMINEAKRGHQITMLYINQQRIDFNVKFGCLHYETPINFVDGRSIQIGKVVDEKITGKVWSLNTETGELEAKNIIAWHDNGHVAQSTDFIQFKTYGIDGGNRFGLTVTPDHKVLTDSGWKKAKNITQQDNLISKYTETINDTYRDFIYGMLAGDSHVCLNTDNTATLRFQDSSNPEYAKWKSEKLRPLIRITETPCNSSTVTNGIRYDTAYNYEFAKIKRTIGKREPWLLLDNLTPMGFALWLMDDGTFNTANSHYRYSISLGRFKNNKAVLDGVVDRLKSYGFECTPRYSRGFIAFPARSTDKIAEYICKYVPECMQYKLPDKFKGKYVDFDLTSVPVLKTDSVGILSINFAGQRKMRCKRKFDISVEDNRNYMVGGKHNGVIVHNSPETMSAGKAFFHEQSVILRNGKVSFTDAEKKLYKSKIDTERDPATKHSINVHKAKVYTLGASCQYVRSIDYKNTTLGNAAGKVMDFGFLIKVAKEAGILGDDSKKLTFMDKDYKTQIELMQQLNRDPQDKLFLSMMIVEKAKQDRLNS